MKINISVREEKYFFHENNLKMRLNKEQNLTFYVRKSALKGS